MYPHTDWVVYTYTDWVVYSYTDWVVHPHTDLVVYPHTDLVVYPYTDWVVHSYTDKVRAAIHLIIYISIYTNSYQMYKLIIVFLPKEKKTYKIIEVILDLDTINTLTNHWNFNLRRLMNIDTALKSCVVISMILVFH